LTERIPADPYWGEPIHTYTRAEALADGVLFDVRKTAREAGFRASVALTTSVWASVDNLSGKYVSAEHSPEGWLWDLLFVAAHAARRRANRNTNSFVYALVMPVGDGTNYRAKCQVGPGDGGEPGVTIMRPDES
jgi:hypothetical protein